MGGETTAFLGAPAVLQNLSSGSSLSCTREPRIFAQRRLYRAPTPTAQLTSDTSTPNASDEGEQMKSRNGEMPFWSHAPAPVYTVCTKSSELGRGNFNILTYCTPCGLGSNPKFAVAIYGGTLTWVNMKQTGRARLCPLSERHASLVPLFGQVSGRDKDKVAEARKLGFDVSFTSEGIPYLDDSSGFVDVAVDAWIDCGDHELAVCSTTSYVNLTAPDEISKDSHLTMQYVRKAGLLGAPTGSSKA